MRRRRRRKVIKQSNTGINVRCMLKLALEETVAMVTSEAGKQKATMKT